ncbi:hypothetical protein LP316_08090 [Thalassotalea sp. LPB0316]|uniref:hypothetical protein n=1 Tax=Thalassotalea sp. LPB0316 TaxID=2769490 RepID=UPI00186624B3|nr:hypothetical protein [Thalassotalea sp. LPB0316]QOL24343.1 hypothetical protein LP316_08090 [Thalassotalea sp. LPB0316]
MIKSTLVVVAVLSFSQLTFADDKTNIWQCIDAQAKAIDANCMAQTIEQDTKHDAFYARLASKPILVDQNVLATIEYFPEQQGIAIKAPIDDSKYLLAISK